jgi:hypothetical protein
MLLPWFVMLPLQFAPTELLATMVLRALIAPLLLWRTPPLAAPLPENVLFNKLTDHPDALMMAPPSLAVLLTKVLVAMAVVLAPLKMAPPVLAVLLKKVLLMTMSSPLELRIAPPAFA